MANEWARATFTIDNILHDENDLLDALESFLTNVGVGWAKASWSDGLYGTLDRHYVRTDRASRERWQFTGDGVTQYCGIRIFYDANAQTTTGQSFFAGQKHIVIQTFLQNIAGTDRQVTTPDYVGSVGTGSALSRRFGSIRILYDTTAPNNYLVIGGEDGFYAEVGRDASTNNLGHGAIMTFGAIPEANSPLDASVQWTAQGLICDMYDGSTGGCRFTHNRNRRFVQNDTAQKNFTAALQPYSARGTRDITVPSMGDQRAYYIGSRDTFFGATRTGTVSTASATALNEDIELDIHATFGLFNTPQGDRYKISPMMMLQSLLEVRIGADSSSGADVIASGLSGVLDPRAWRQIFRFAAVDYTLLPFANIQDAVSGATYRVSRMEDNGRFSQFGVEWPASELTVTV